MTIKNSLGRRLLLFTFSAVFITVFIAVFTAPVPSAAQDRTSSCKPLGLDKDALLELRASGFEINDTDRRERFATELVGCIDNPDPVLRDQIAYEGLMTLLRERELRVPAIQHVRKLLLEKLSGRKPDEQGFRRPFAALLLSEVARADRIDPIFSDEERVEIVTAAVTYLKSIKDYRGYSEVEGWRHGVAHTSDLLLQLALNPALHRDQLLAMLDAIASQVVPSEAHFYIYGESARLARPIFAIAQRSMVTASEWAAWFDTVGAPAPFESWSDVFTSQTGLARLHNTTAFVQAIYVSASARTSSAYGPLQVGALGILKILP